MRGIIFELFNIRNAAVLEKVFLYLCYNTSNIVNFATMSKELDNTPAVTLSNYIEYLERANLELGGKKILKAKPKVYIADAAIMLKGKRLGTNIA